MPFSTEEDWSESDEEIVSGMETDVLLGVPDGSVETDADLQDAAVSRIGGLPAFLPSREPPYSSSQCKVCSNPMELLLQLWCPFEDSPMDRALYVWGCARSTCQRQAGSIRAWRGLRYDAAYAAKLKKRKTFEAGQRKTTTSPVGLTTSANPFFVSSHTDIRLSFIDRPVSQMKTTTKPTSSGAGDQIFANPTIGIPNEPEEDHGDGSDTEGDASSEHSPIIAMTSLRVADSLWVTAPSYPAVYLSTLSEYIPKSPRANALADVGMEDPAEAHDKAGKDPSLALETYENSVVIDNIFDQFARRVGFTGEQCLRYELKGTPLPFASDKVFDLLFPAVTQTLLPITKVDFKVTQPARRSYSATSIPSCPCCKSNRVFECQLMPNLINVLRDSVDDRRLDMRKLTDEQRIKAVQDALKRNKQPDSRGMEWGTCMVFSCGNNCCLDVGGQDDRECWREEYVLAQWDE